MRSWLRKLLDRLLGCHEQQVAKRVDTYGWSGPPLPKKKKKSNNERGE